MKRKWIETGQDLLIILMNHLVLISLCVTAMGLLRQDEHNVWLWSVLLIVPFIFYWARVKIRNFFLFFVLHLAVTIGVLFLKASILPKLLMLFVGVVYVIWSIKIRVKAGGHGESILGPVLMTVLLGGMLLIETSYSQKGWAGIYIVMAIIYAAGYLLYMFISRYLRFLVVNESSAANIPEAEIFNKGFSQTFMYIACMATFLLLTANVECLSYIFLWIKNMLLKLIRFWISGVGSTEEEVVITESVEPAPPDMGIGMFADTGDPPMIWVVLEKIARIGVVLFLVGLIVFGIAKGFQKVWKGFHKDSSKDEKEITNGIDIRENCTIEKSKKEAGNLFSFLNNREKIRKIYRKQVLKNKTAIIGDLDAEYLEHMTAKECCDKITAEQLKNMYEKARYSEEKITSEDVRVAKRGG